MAPTITRCPIVSSPSRAEAELLDHTDRLVSEDQARLDGILAADNVHIRSTDGRGGDADDRFPDLWSGPWHFFEGQALLALEDNGFHRGYAYSSPFPTRRWPAAYSADVSLSTPHASNTSFRRTSSKFALTRTVSPTPHASNTRSRFTDSKVRGSQRAHVAH
jgi:hypothetical protein